MVGGWESRGTFDTHVSLSGGGVVFFGFVLGGAGLDVAGLVMVDGMTRRELGTATSRWPMRTRPWILEGL